MSKARIYRGKIDPNIIAELEQLLAGIGCEQLDDAPIEPAEPGEEPAPDTEEGELEPEVALAPAFLVILDEACAADPETDPAIMAAVTRGERIIGIWPQGGGGAATPKCFPDVGCDTVVWDPGCIKPSIDGTPQHQAPDGSPAMRPQTPTNVC
ncbi:hypothetical protein [Sphingopyxis alaskensis]|uniref:hypothetical protein n=1 Tax=Sphingopyxis alaskensis TaxID=117207 RepID=UPI003918C158